MTDMVVLVPARGRPGNARRLIEECAKTCRADTRLLFGLDDDDAWRYAGITEGNEIIRPRMGLAPWTNELAAAALIEYPGTPVLCSLGDDHVPVTDGWDEQLIEALGQIGGGWAYPDDSRRDDIAEAVAVSSVIAKGLGWLVPAADGKPIVHHWCCDNAWTALARAVGRLEYLHHVKVPHYHPHSPVPEYQVPADPTYEEARWSYDLDKRRYLHWRDQGGLIKDAAKVREILGMEA